MSKRSGTSQASSSSAAIFRGQEEEEEEGDVEGSGEEVQGGLSSRERIQLAPAEIARQLGLPLSR